MKKVLKILLVLMGLFVLTLVAGVIYLKVQYPPERVRAIVEKQLSKVGKRDIQVTGASLKLYPTLALVIEGIRVSNTVRTNKVEKPAQLWAFLKTQNLDKRFVNVNLNGKDVDLVYKNDASLKAGDKLRISRQEFRKKEPLFALGKLVVAVEVLPLMQKKVIIKKILLDKLQILVEANSRGSFNFDDLIPKSDPKKAKPKPKQPKKKSSGALPISLNLKSFEIRDSKIVYLNHKTRQRVVLEDINQSLSVNSNTTMTDVTSKGLFEIKRVSVSGKGIPVRKSGVYFMVKHKLKTNLKTGALKLDYFTVGFQKTHITTSGTVKGLNGKVRDLDLKVVTNTLKLHDLFKEVPPALFPKARKMSVAGTAKLSLAIKGKVGKPGVRPFVKGFFKLSNGMFKYASLPKSINKVHADLRFTPDTLDVKKLSMRLGTNPISLVAKVKNFKKPYVDMALKADVDLGSLKDAIKMPKGTTATGRIKADITAKGKVEPKNPDAMAVKGMMEFKDVVATTPKVKKPVEVNGVFDFSNQEVQLKKLVTKIGRSSFTTELKVRDYMGQVLPKKKRVKMTHITYTMNAPLLDLNEMLGVKKGKKGSKSSSSSSSKSSSKSSSSSSKGDNTPIVLPKLPLVTLNGKIRVKKMLYSNLTINNGAIDVSYAKGLLKFALSAGMFGGKIKEVFTLNITNPSKIRVLNQFSATRMEANDFITNFNAMPQKNGTFLDRFKRMDNVYGKLDLVTQFATHGITVRELKSNLTGSIKTKLHKGKIKNASLFEQLKSAVPSLVRKFLPKLKDLRMTKALAADMHVKNGKLHINRFNIPSRKISFAGMGTIGIDKKADMRFNVILDRRLSRRILSAQRRLIRGAGGVLKRIGGQNKLLGKLTGAASKALGGGLIKADKKGRVIPIIGSTGSLSKLLHRFIGFAGNVQDKGDKGGAGGDLVGQGKKMLKNKLKQAKKAAMAAANKAKKKALAAANKAKREAAKRAAAAKKKAMAAANKAKRDAAKRAAAAKAAAAKKAADAKKKANDALKNSLKKW